MSRIGGLLLEAMHEKGLSYSDLEKLTGIPKSSLQRYFTARTEKIPIDYVEIICPALGLSAPEVMGWVEPPRPVLSEDEHELVEIYRQLNATGQSMVMKNARAALEEDGLRKKSSTASAG